MIREIMVSLFLLMGGILSLIAVAGVLRMPDIFTRMHAATKVGTVGVSSISTCDSAARYSARIFARARRARL